MQRTFRLTLPSFRTNIVIEQHLPDTTDFLASNKESLGGSA